MSPIEVLERFREDFHKKGDKKQERVFDRAIAILEVADPDHT